MAYEKTLPNGSPVLKEGEFAQRYLAAMTESGTLVKTVEVVKSWHSYQRDPAGHFISGLNKELP